MANRWGISKDVEEIVKKRDLSCVYCGTPFSDHVFNNKTKPTWEHIINDLRIKGPGNIVLCCASCNASKGNKKLEDWLKSPYCRKKGITERTVSPIVRMHLEV